jgi:hypothetical protein
VPNGPAKHCGIVGSFPPPFTGEDSERSEPEGALRATCPLHLASLGTSPVNGGGKLTLIHARQNKQVSEESFSKWWRRRLAYAFAL